MIIGKFGGAPFATEGTANEFITKYNVSGKVIPYKYGYGILIDLQTCTLDESQINARSLAIEENGELVETVHEGTYLQRVSNLLNLPIKNKSISEKKEDYIPADELFRCYGIQKAISECYDRRNELNEHTASWVRKIYYVVKKNGEYAIQTTTLKRLYGLTKRLNINIKEAYEKP